MVVACRMDASRCGHSAVRVPLSSMPKSVNAPCASLWLIALYTDSCPLTAAVGGSNAVPAATRGSGYAHSRHLRKRAYQRRCHPKERKPLEPLHRLERGRNCVPVDCFSAALHHHPEARLFCRTTRRISCSADSPHRVQVTYGYLSATSKVTCSHPLVPWGFAVKRGLLNVLEY
jgi:hypothetical protein